MGTDKDILIVELMAEVNRLKKVINSISGKKGKVVSPGYSGETTAKERADMRIHLAELEKQIQSKKKVKPKPPNLLKINQTVELIDNISEAYRKGIVQLLACRLALPSIRECDKKECEHSDKSYAWVRWQDGKIIAYHYTKLAIMKPEDLLPKIGKELSGRVGQWEFDAKTQTWKKDNSDKLYTQEEFADIMYYETHPYAKQEAVDFVKMLRKI
jgi:hypothetical protein